MLNKLEKKHWIIITIIGFTILHLIVGATLNLTDDEAYYWNWSRNLDISYFDHPPMVAYFIAFFTFIFGNTNMAVRMPGVFSIMVVSIMIYKIVMYLYKDYSKAFIAILIFNVLPLITMGAAMTLPDSPLLLFFSVSLYLFIRIIYEKNGKLWYILGIVTGLGLLSKYNMCMVCVSVFIYLLMDKDERYWLKRVEPYAAFILAMLFFTPVLLWNMNHNWASFGFHLYERQSHSFTIKPFYASQFIVSQFLVVSPILFVGFFIAFFRNIKKKDVKLLGLYGLVIFVLFLTAGLFSQTKIHWAAVSYIPLSIIFAVYMKIGKFWKIGGIGLAIFLSVIIYVQSYYPLIKMEPKLDVTTDMHGWDIIGKEVQTIYDGEDKNLWFLFSHRYQVTSQLAFYLPKKEYVYSLNDEREQYDYWKDEKELVGKNGIYVSHSFYKVEPEKFYMFDKTELIKTIDILRAGTVYRTFYIYKCYNYKGLRRGE